MLNLVEQLARALGLSISKTTSNAKTKAEEENTSEELYQLMKEMADSGAFHSIKGPVAWQREQRKDRILPGRE